MSTQWKGWSRGENTSRSLPRHRFVIVVHSCENVGAAATGNVQYSIRCVRRRAMEGKPRLKSVAARSFKSGTVKFEKEIIFTCSVIDEKSISIELIRETGVPPNNKVTRWIGSIDLIEYVTNIKQDSLTLALRPSAQSQIESDDTMWPIASISIRSSAVADLSGTKQKPSAIRPNSARRIKLSKALISPSSISRLEDNDVGDSKDSLSVNEDSNRNIVGERLSEDRIGSGEESDVSFPSDEESTKQFIENAGIVDVGSRRKSSLRVNASESDISAINSPVGSALGESSYSYLSGGDDESPLVLPSRRRDQFRERKSRRRLSKEYKEKLLETQDEYVSYDESCDLQQMIIPDSIVECNGPGISPNCMQMVDSHASLPCESSTDESHNSAGGTLRSQPSYAFSLTYDSAQRPVRTHCDSPFHEHELNLEEPLLSSRRVKGTKTSRMWSWLNCCRWGW